MSSLAYTFDSSGQSIFARPKPIDLSAAASRTGYGLDLDLDDEDEDDDDDDDDVEAGRRRDDEVLFDATATPTDSSRPPVAPPAENVWS
jgi:hypothetical protein